MTRTRQSIKNIIVALLSYVITLSLGFFTRRFFARLMGEEYLGVNSLFSNIISVMSVVELGFGSAIIYNLYKPFRDNNISQVKSLVKYYKKVYSIIAAIIIGLGILITPFIPAIVGEVSISANLFLVFWLFIIDTASSYLLTYKRSVFFADQKNYVITIIHTLMYALIGIIQIFALFLWSNYYLFLALQISFHLFENIIISLVANKKYPYLKDVVVEPLEPIIKQDIIHKVKGLLFHQIGSSIVLGTDYIIMSMTKSLGVVMVGKYSNYVMVINNLNSMTGQIFQSVTASVGNLLLENDLNKSYNVYKRILFLNAALCNFICISVFVCIDSLIVIWLGPEYVLPKTIAIIIVANFYIQGMKRTCGIFKNAGGIFFEDRFVPLVESIINLVFSIVLVLVWGVSGIVLGTIISSMVHWLYDFPKYVYGVLLKRSIKQYVLDYIPFFTVFILSLSITKLVSELYIVQLGPWISFVLNILISISIPNLLFFLVFFKSKECRYWLDFLHSKVFKKRKNVN